MSMMPGATVGPYRIVEQIGRGGMATVYKAFQPALARFVAIKVLPAFFAEDSAFRERFQQEAIAVAKLRHPNILLVFDYGEEGGVTYLVSEYVDGGTLAEQVGSPLPVDYTIDLLKPIASALDYAHSRSILHRDVKPSNILLSRDGTPVLSDFGLARIVGSLTRLTRTGMTVGTPEYMAPEQGMAENVGPSADDYALAVVAYEMLTGRVPFSAETPLAVLLAHLHKPLPLPRSVNPALPEAVEAVLLKGLAKVPGDRYPTAGEFINALADARRSPSSTSQPVVSASNVPAGESSGVVTPPSPAPQPVVPAAAHPPGAPPAHMAAPAAPSTASGPLSPLARRLSPRLLAATAALVVLVGGGIVAAMHLGPRGTASPHATAVPTAIVAAGTATVRPTAVSGALSATPPGLTPSPSPGRVRTAVGAAPGAQTATALAATSSTPVPTLAPRPTSTVPPISTSAPPRTPAGALPVALLAAHPISNPGPDDPERRYFPASQHQLTGLFLEYWNAHLGFLVLGLPLTEQFQQGDADLQYCERGLLVLRNGVVTLAPLGRELTANRHLPALLPTVAGVFARYYANHQGPELFGAPLAAADYELNGDGSGRRYLVQWFERGRLEYHPETPPAFRVLPGLVGKEALRRAEQR